MKSNNETNGRYHILVHGIDSDKCEYLWRERPNTDITSTG